MMSGPRHFVTLHIFYADRCNKAPQGFSESRNSRRSERRSMHLPERKDIQLRPVGFAEHRSKILPARIREAEGLSGASENTAAYIQHAVRTC